VVNHVSAPSKSRLGLGRRRSLAILAIIGAGTLVGGMGLGYGITASMTPGRSTMEVTVDTNFGVSLWNGTVVASAFNSSYNCSGIGSFSMKIGWDEYYDFRDVLQASPGGRHNASTIRTALTLDWYTIAYSEELVSGNFFDNSIPPSETAAFEGRKHVFDYGNYVVVVPAIYMMTHIAGDDKSIGFTFKSINKFMDCMDNATGVNYDQFMDANFLLGGNTLVVKELKFDIENQDNSLLVVVFNGVETNMPVSTT
jgi:hypothetical protein